MRCIKDSHSTRKLLNNQSRHLDKQRFHVFFREMGYSLFHDVANEDSGTGMDEESCLLSTLILGINVPLQIDCWLILFTMGTMFIGHFAVGLGAKAVRPAISLGTLFVAAQFIDLLWPLLLQLGVERVQIDPGNTAYTPLNFSHYPISHSLLTTVGWGLLLGVIYKFLRSDTRGAILIGLLAVSHWVLDLIVHRPDLPLYPGDAPLVGLGLWNSIPFTVVVEGLLFAAGVALYLRTTTSKNKKGLYGFWGLIVFLVVINIGNLFGPPPPDEAALAWVGHLQWLIVAWAYWLDSNRTNKSA
jgi:hypothetical protein